MGKTGQPVDSSAMEEKRKLAKRLLDEGLPPRTVARQLGASNSWVYRLRQQFRDGDFDRRQPRRA